MSKETNPICGAWLITKRREELKQALRRTCTDLNIPMTAANYQAVVAEAHLDAVVDQILEEEEQGDICTSTTSTSDPTEEQSLSLDERSQNK